MPLSSVGASILLLRVGIHAAGWRNVQRAGKIIDDRIDQILHALVLEGGTADHRDELVRDRLAANARLEHLRRDRLLLEESRPDLVVEIGDCGDQVAVSLVDHVLVLVGNLVDVVGGTHHVVVEIDDRLLD